MDLAKGKRCQFFREVIVWSSEVVCSQTRDRPLAMIDLQKNGLCLC